MPHYKYLIIGGGMTGDAAARGIREIDSNGSIGVISAERHRPYNRPPLSKAAWKGMPIEQVWRLPEVPGVEFHLERTARGLDPQSKSVTDDHGAAYTYEKLLLATGGTPRRLPFGGDEILYYRTLDDYERLRKMAGERVRFAVIGGGFIGSEIAAALAMNGRDVVMLFPGDGIGDRIFPPDLRRFLNSFYREKGVSVLPEESAVSLEPRGSHFALKIRNAATKVEREVEVDGLVAGIGIEPNVELARAAGLRIENGIVVDEFLQASHPDIYAAGDVASFYNPALGHRMRVEHEDNANTMGRAAGRAMAGQPEPYHHLPFFYSDLFELGYEAVGDLDARLETIPDWKEPYREGVVYYMNNGRVRGALLWNVWGQVDAARRLIEQPGPFRAADLKGRLLQAA
jgi:3-phenylpropionate/trans-cinnamate dioxygenase ferredoxin reductase subunit